MAKKRLRDHPRAARIPFGLSREIETLAVQALQHLDPLGRFKRDSIGAFETG